MNLSPNCCTSSFPAPASSEARAGLADGTLLVRQSSKFEKAASAPLPSKCCKRISVNEEDEDNDDHTSSTKQSSLSDRHPHDYENDDNDARCPQEVSVSVTRLCSSSAANETSQPSHATSGFNVDDHDVDETLSCHRSRSSSTTSLHSNLSSSLVELSTDDEEVDDRDWIGHDVGDSVATFVASNTSSECEIDSTCLSTRTDDDKDGDGTVQRQKMARSSSILKARCRSEPLHIRNNRRSWKALPQPDLEKISYINKKKTDSDCMSRDSAEIDITATPSVSSSAASHKRKCVTFTAIRIRSYHQTIGDNPSVSYGPPIQLDWTYEPDEIEQSIDVYEQTRRPRRTQRQMALSYYQRQNILSWVYGATDEELRHAKRESKRIKMNRSITSAFSLMMPIESAIECARRKVKKLLRKSK